MLEAEIYRELTNMVTKGESGVLATIILAKGSAPRKAGAKMLIKRDGTFIGTVGGGGVEKQVLEKAAEVMKTRQPQVCHFDLSGTGRDAGMICGGQTDVFLEPIQTQETLYLFGAGHISQSTAAMGKILGFRVVVIDPRPDYNNNERFPDADLLLAKDYDDAFPELHIEPNDYIIIYTTGHRQDEQCLAYALKTSAGYIGMIGSKKKALEVKQRVLEGGIPKELVDKVHSPIGLEIGAETPGEIAISILAEIIRDRRGAG